MTSPLQNSARWQEILNIWHDNRWLYVITGILLGILVLPALEQISGNLNNLLTNLVPEAVGIVFTVLILDRLAENRNREELKARLYNELRSPAIGQGTAALAWLKRENWIQSDTLIDADLHRVNWQDAYVGDLTLTGANLNGANLRNVSNQITDETGTIHNFPIALNNASLRYAQLEEAVLIAANMHDSILTKAHLKNAVLVHANLKNAQLEKADLNQASLMAANLENANLQWANLTNTNLQSAHCAGANLLGVNLEGAIINEVNWGLSQPATLPDGTMWTPDIDMQKFTHPEHPEFDSTLEKINTIRREQGQEPI